MIAMLLLGMAALLGSSLWLISIAQQEIHQAKLYPRHDQDGPEKE